MFYAPLAGISPGEVALISGSLPGGVKLSTGVMVLYSDDESFSLMTPQGHPFSGWITFSAHEAEGTPVAQVQVLMRANDPLYELGLRMGGHKMEDQMWQQTLTNLARHFGMNRAGRDERGLRGPQAAVERVQERLAQRRHPLRPVPGDRPAALAPRPVAKVNEPAASMHRRGGRVRVMNGSTYDAVVVGAGPNGLAAAVELARNGRSVAVLEAEETVGGGVRSAEVTLPGFVHDLGSAIHPLGYASPFFDNLPLEEHGLEWIHPPAPLAHPLDDGTAAMLERSTEETGATLGPDAQSVPDPHGPAWRRTLGGYRRRSRDLPACPDTRSP